MTHFRWKLAIRRLLSVSRSPRFSLLKCLCMASRGAHQHSADGAIHIEQADAAVCNLILADLIGVTHAARFQDVKSTVTLPICFERTERNPGIDQGWNPLISTRN